ncbi:hypothetical protein F5X68DRAFT_174455 [Plectosphaerella plurivora]|uniref:Uncharacterized protein n=1 Tax=Plectosphaerella plurivora TaxID=936078 RepID=A0A9P8V4U2_9PEZI|nr:hypothetical protein F5X68DRAFT_174455 [Plectosphaerella plurivora]
MATPAPFSVTVHPFPSNTPRSCAYEYGPSGKQNALIFIGGLTAGPHSSSLPHHLAAGLTDSELDFGVWEFRMRSSYTGFGFSSLANDAEDTGAFVTYLRKLGKSKIVLMGLSTGSQDCLEYANRAKSGGPEIDGYVLVSPVSDRETATMMMPQDAFEATIAAAQHMIDDGRKGDAMPQAAIPPIFPSPVTAYRWHSLAASGGDDDYFSSHLDDATLSRTFGRVERPILILPSEKDESVPPTLDKAALLSRWLGACQEGIGSPESAVNPGADHAVSVEESRKWLSDKVFRFLKTLS